MSIICKIDNRERDLIQYFDKNPIHNIQKLNLDIGDIQICLSNIDSNIHNNIDSNIHNNIDSNIHNNIDSNIQNDNDSNIQNDNDLNNKNIINNNQHILVIIERKTFDDLSTSIKDGRYKEQKNRILNSISNNVRKIYLLEGSKNDFKLPSSVLEGTVINTMIRDNIHIYFSKNLNDTIKFINNIIKNIVKYSNIIINNEINIDTNNCLINTNKKSNMNSETCFSNMMSGIPGISKKTANIFIIRFKNINNMFYYFYNDLNNDYDLIIKDLENMKVAENQRKLGKKHAINIYNFLFK